MLRLSEERLDELERSAIWAINGRLGYHYWVDPDETLDLIAMARGYRRAAALEDMLREWAADMKHGWAGKNGGEMHETCGYCYKDIPDHYPECLVARTEALLAEGDE